MTENGLNLVVGIMCAGKGSRYSESLGTKPAVNKCVFDMSGKIVPPLKVIIDNFISLGVKDFIVSVGKNREIIIKLSEWYPEDCSDVRIRCISNISDTDYGSISTKMSILSYYDEHLNDYYGDDYSIILTEGDFVLDVHSLSEFISSKAFTAVLPSINNVYNTLVRVEGNTISSIYYDPNHSGKILDNTNESLQIWRLDNKKVTDLINIYERECIINISTKLCSNIYLYNMLDNDLTVYISDENVKYYNCNTIEDVLDMNDNLLDIRNVNNGSILKDRDFFSKFEGRITKGKYSSLVSGEPNPNNIPDNDLSIYNTLSFTRPKEVEDYLSRISYRDNSLYYIVEGGVPYIIGMLDLDYLNNNCRIHEKVIHTKVEKCTEYFKNVCYNSSPIMLSFDSKDSDLNLEEIISECDANLYNNNEGSITQYGKVHDDIAERVLVSMNNIEKMYILDGHHRTQSYINSKSPKVMVAITSSNYISMEGYYHEVRVNFSELTKIFNDKSDYYLEISDDLTNDSKYLQFIYKNSNGNKVKGRILSEKSQDYTYEDILKQLNLYAESDRITHGLVSDVENSQSMNSLAIIPAMPTIGELIYKINRGKLYNPKSTAVSHKVPSGIFHHLIEYK